MNVDCNGCGASLKIGETTHFATCAKCAARLEVKRSESAVYTEVLASGVAVLKKELARLDAEPVSAPAPAPTDTGGESVLRLVVGGVLIASDVYWWISNPSLQSLYIRIVILAAGIWLVLSGGWRTMTNARVRIRHMAEAHAAVEARKKELKRAISAGTPDAKPK